MIQSGVLLWLVQGFNHIKTLLQQSHYYQLQRGVHLHPPYPPKSATAEDARGSTDFATLNGLSSKLLKKLPTLVEVLPVVRHAVQLLQIQEVHTWPHSNV